MSGETDPPALATSGEAYDLFPHGSHKYIVAAHERQDRTPVNRSTSIPRIVIAGTHSGCGKTTIALGLMAALGREGYSVQPFKVGPDFIDPTHHTAACGRISRNLDPFMMGEEGVLSAFLRACDGADIAVIEGVMGLFDGLDGTDTASTAHVARILGAPVVLVADVRGTSRSANAMIDGFTRFEPGTRIAGVIYNRIGSPRHRGMIEASLRLPAFGWVPRSAPVAIANRHLGLRMAHETLVHDQCADIVRDSCDLQAILGAAGSAGPLVGQYVPAHPRDKRAVIGVAHDEAFCFYYEDNLDLLRASGAELVFFSPLRGECPDADALYLGGGYPELHARALGGSPTLRAIKKASDDGMPVYAECGGLIALCETLDAEGEVKMSGILPARAEMTRGIQALGYVEGECTGGPAYLGPGSRLTGHEFHYSRVECLSGARFSIRLRRGKGISEGMDGLHEHEVTGTYLHACFSPEFAGRFVDSAEKFRRR